MLARLSAFVIWALVAATAVFWGLRLLVQAPAAPAYVVAVGDAASVRGDLSRLLGSAPVNAPPVVVATESSSRFRLIGIVAPKYAGEALARNHGVALIAVDGKIPKAFAVGARLDGDLVLQSVGLRTASIGSGQGAPAITLELPPLAAAATGTLPVGASGGSYVAPVGGVVPQYVPQQPLFPQQPVPPPNFAQPLPGQLTPGAQAPIAPPPRPESNAPTQ